MSPIPIRRIIPKLSGLRLSKNDLTVCVGQTFGNGLAGSSGSGSLRRTWVRFGLELQSSEALHASRMAHSWGSCQEGSAPYHTCFSTGLYEYPHNTAAGFPSRVSDPRPRARRKLQCLL